MNNIFLSQQIRQKYFQPLLISQTNRAKDLHKRDNCITTLVLSSNCTFVSIFLTLQICPCFFNLKLPLAPIPWRRLNGVKWKLKRHKCPWYEWSNNQYDFLCTNLLWMYFGQMTSHILYRQEYHHCHLHQLFHHQAQSVVCFFLMKGRTQCREWNALPSPVQCEETAIRTRNLPVRGGKTLPLAPDPPFVP